MLEKNKDYVEFTLQCTTVERTRDKDYRQVCLNGYSDYDFPGVPMDVVCKEFDHKVVMISKRDFDRLQAENEQLKKKLGEFDFMGWMESAKLWKKRYDDIFKLIGFSSVEEIQDYLTNEAECDTLQEAILKLKDQVKYTCDEWYSANSSNNSWKAAAECNSPKELIEKLNLLRDDISGRSTVTERYKRDIEKWQKATGCLRPEDISTASLVTKAMQLDQEVKILNGALQEWREGTGCPSPSSAKTLIENGRTHIVYLNDPLGVIAKWEKVTGYDRPEVFLKWKANIEGIVEAWKVQTGCKYPGEARELLEKWKDMTKCETPEAAATWISSYESACGRGNRLAEMVEKLKEEVVSWKNVTGYSTPEDYMHARISGAFHTPFDYTASWQKATECNSPDDVEIRIKALNERIDESEACYNHLLMLTGFGDEGEIEDALDKCDHSTLRKALVDYEFDYEELLKLTGYKSNQDIRVALNHSEQFVYESMRELINSLKRQAKFTNLNWQNSTGFITPEKCGEYIKKLEDKLSRINTISEEG